MSAESPTSEVSSKARASEGVVLTQVSKSFGPVRALASVTASFPPAVVTAVLGANGSGKSTLLAIVGTLARPTSGKVSHGAIGKSAQEIRARLGWLGHDSLCYADLTGRENLELAARLYGVDPTSAVAEAVQRFELTAFLGRPFRTYSRGQRQRVALARALIHAPRLLLLDEPTTGLDAAGCARLTAVVREEAAKGSIVLVVTHDEGFAAEVASRTIRLERGRVAS